MRVCASCIPAFQSLPQAKTICTGGRGGGVGGGLLEVALDCGVEITEIEIKGHFVICDVLIP